MIKKLGDFLLSNKAYAAIIVLLLMLSPALTLFCTVLAASIVVLITLQQGYKSGAFLLFWMLVPSVVSLFFHKIGVFDFEWMVSCLLFALALLLRAYSSWRLVLEILLLIGIVALVAVHLINPDIAMWWKSHILHIYNSSSVVSAMSIEEKSKLEATAVMYSQMATGILIFYVMLFVVFVLMLGRYWQAIVLNAKEQFITEVINIRMNKLLAVVALLCAIGFCFKVPLFLDGMFIVFVPFIVAGFSYLHSLSQSRPWISFVLVVFYFGLIIFQYIVAPVIAVLGLIDIGLDLRNRKRFQVKKINKDK